MYYDHFGQGISNAFNASGSFGLASKLSNAMGALRTETSPRFVSRTTLPNLPGAISIGTQNFPFVFPQTNTSTAFLISWAWTTRSKLPTEVYNLSIERFTWGLHLRSGIRRSVWPKADAATRSGSAGEPLDPKSGVTYFQAGAQLAAAVDQNPGNAKANVVAIPYFENMFPQVANVSSTSCPNPSHTATQAIYCNEFFVFRKVLGEITALADLDFYCSYGCPAAAPQNRFFQGQFSSLYAWSSMGTAPYNAGRFALRHPMSHAFKGI
jgi:hypothetical protein